MKSFEEAGALRIRAILSRSELHALQRLNSASPSRAGNRALLSLPWCKALAARIKSRTPQLGLLNAVQCTLFEKSAASNWLVAPHQDLSLPINPNSTTGRTTGDGVRIARADAETLGMCIAVRVHLDDCDRNDGPLRMISGSHRNGILTSAAISQSARVIHADLQIANAGDAWMMSPLIIHASSRAAGTSRRRVLHYLFAPSRFYASQY
jgi:ectoine hydroxylase-related dioxygenase (phytanoyl-CoA dioxygenase family)